MSTWRAEIIARPKQFKCLIRATVIFEVDDDGDDRIAIANDQANAYARRLGEYDSADVDTLYEIGGTS